MASTLLCYASSSAVAPRGLLWRVPKPAAWTRRTKLSNGSINRYFLLSNDSSMGCFWRKNRNQFRGAHAGLGGGNDNSKGLFQDPMFADGSDPTECPVPLEQQPIIEYQNLLKTPLFSWPTYGPVNYGLRLAAIGILFSMVIGWPVSAVTFNPKDQALQCVLGTVASGQAAVILATLRLYLGWAYVGNRLSSATVEYEESGWYDGQIWVKTPELLARDRLLASYKVKPPLSRLKSTLIGLAISLTLTSVSIFIFPSPKFSPSVPLESAIINSKSNSIQAYDEGSVKLYEPRALIEIDEDSDDAEIMEAMKNYKPSIMDHMRRR